jgi:hypothetical protein
MNRAARKERDAIFAGAFFRGLTRDNDVKHFGG